MNPHEVWCRNVAGPARGQRGQGNIGVHSRQERRYRCRVGRKTFGARTGTPVHRRRTAEVLIVRVITLVSWGCPLVAVEHAFGLQSQTIRDWLEAAGTHAAAIHHAQVTQPRDLSHGQADELRVKPHCGIVWMAMPMLVATRRWLGGAISPRRDQRLVPRIVALFAAAAVVAPLLLVVDGFASDVDAFRQAFRQRVHRGGREAPRTVPWPDLIIGQGVKQYVGKRVVGVTRRLRQGPPALAERLLAQPPGCQGLNTAYRERLHGTCRARLAPVARRTQHLVHRKELLHAGMYLVGAVQLLHGACQADRGERGDADARNGGGDHGSLLECPGVAVASRAAATLGAAEAARAALQGHAATH